MIHICLDTQLHLPCCVASFSPFLQFLVSHLDHPFPHVSHFPLSFLPPPHFTSHTQIVLAGHDRLMYFFGSDPNTGGYRLKDIFLSSSTAKTITTVNQTLIAGDTNGRVLRTSSTYLHIVFIFYYCLYIYLTMYVSYIFCPYYYISLILMYVRSLSITRKIIESLKSTSSW